MRLSLILSSLIFLVSFSSFAQIDVTQNESRIDSNQFSLLGKNNQDPQGWWPFLSLGFGHLDFDSENAGDGRSLQAKGLLSFYEVERRFIFEGGAGLQNSEAGGSSTTSGILEASARMRWLSKWQAGPLASFFIGNGDDYGSSNQDITTFIGAHLLYDIPMNNGDLMRIGGRWMTDVGIPGEFANILMFELHYGLALGEKAAPAVVEVERPRTDHLARLAFENAEWDGPQLAYSTLQVEPNTTDKNRVARLGQQLMAEGDLVTSIRVIGHADERGSTYSNQLLSHARANSVANALIFAGVPKSQVEVVAMGESQPVIQGKNNDAWERNRRVELEFKGVRDLARLRTLLREAGIE